MGKYHRNRSIYQTIKPGEISITGKETQGLPNRYSLENALYANNEWKINDRWSLSYGLRLSAFTILGKGDYYTLDSRLIPLKANQAFPEFNADVLRSGIVTRNSFKFEFVSSHSTKQNRDHEASQEIFNATP